MTRLPPLDGVALTRRDLPDVLITEHDLSRRIVTVGKTENQEIHFLHEASPRFIPIWHNGALRIVFWGSSDGRLPSNGICKQSSLERGVWAHLRPKEVVIPVPLVKHGGRWFDVREGLRGIVVKDQQQKLHAYVITVPASHYYENMTKRDRMPVFVGDDYV